VSAWPPLDPERLADAVAALAEQVAERPVRAQLHALSGILRNLRREELGATGRVELESALAAALAAEDEPAVLAAVRELAAADRAVVRPVDWTAASSG
jgi:hypothetical protein